MRETAGFLVGISFGATVVVNLCVDLGNYINARGDCCGG
jgi:hypothetical protein